MRNRSYLVRVACVGNALPTYKEVTASLDQLADVELLDRHEARVLDVVDGNVTAFVTTVLLSSHQKLLVWR